MATFNYVIETGLIVADTSTVREEVVAEYRGALGDDLVVDDETPQGALINGETISRTGMMRNNAQVANQINPRYARGVFLDGICNFLGLERTPALPSINRDCILTGAARTTIPAGVEARDANQNRWRSTRAIQLDATGRALVNFRCMEVGPVACPAGTMNRVVTQVLGWETVTNPTAAELGRLRQSDASLRTLRLNTLGRQGISVSEAVISSLYDPSVGCRSVAYRENEAKFDRTIDGVFLKANSIWVCCDGGDDALIAMALLRCKTVGAAWNGKVTVEVTDLASGQKYEVTFDRPTKVPMEVRIKVRQGLYQGETQLDVADAVVNYAEGEVENLPGFVLGKPQVSPAEVGAAVAYQLPGLFISSVEARRVGTSDWTRDEIAFNLDELPTIQAGSVQVQVIG